MHVSMTTLQLIGRKSNAKAMSGTMCLLQTIADRITRKTGCQTDRQTDCNRQAELWFRNMLLVSDTDHMETERCCQ